MNTEVRNLNLLRQDFENKKQVALFVGAGINYSPGVRLLWDDVINYLFEIVVSRMSIEKGLTGKNHLFLKHVFGLDSELSDVEISEDTKGLIKNYATMEFPTLIKASIIKSVLGKSYISYIQDFIYLRCNKSILKSAFERCYSINRKNAAQDSNEEKEFYSLYQTARLIILCPSIKAIVTYNYDNYLRCAISILLDKPEQYFEDSELQIIRKRNLKVNDITAPIYNQTLSENDVCIYHVHGYIPPPSEADDLSNSNIVLSLDEYHEYSQNDLSTWHTASQIHYLSHYVCVFLGSSLSDITTQRLLHYVKKIGNNERLYQVCAYNSEQIRESAFPEVYRALIDKKLEFYTSYGLTPVVSYNGFEYLYKQIVDTAIKADK